MCKPPNCPIDPAQPPGSRVFVIVAPLGASINTSPFGTAESVPFPFAFPRKGVVIPNPPDVPLLRFWEKWG